MRVLFWGTPEFALPSLRALLGEGHVVVGVVTQPDRPAGRGRTLRPSPVKAEADLEGVPVWTPQRPADPEFVDVLRSQDADVSVVVAYGHLLPSTVLEIPREGSINVHASLLPELRGAAPVHWAIARGYERTGVTIMRMTAGLDEGPVLVQRSLDIGPEETSTGLALKLSELGAEALIETLARIEAGQSLEPREQDHDRATYAPKVDRETARIDWNRPGQELVHHVRAMDRMPGAWTSYEGALMKLFVPALAEGRDDVGPGTVIGADPPEGLVVQSGVDAVRFDEVQPAGKRRMTAEAWLRGKPLREGARLS